MKESPVFKIGDWVREYDKYSSDVNVVKVDENLLADIEGGRVYNTYELWTPELGEWCWFYNTGNRPQLAKFIGYSKITTEKRYIPDYEELEDNYGYDYCSPFIGTLPETYEQKKQLNFPKKKRFTL